MRRRGPHVPDAGLAVPRDRSGHSVHYIVERMVNTRWAWFGLLAALPLSLAAQDRLRTMPGYESFQRVENEGPLARGGTLAASWVDANTIEYSQRGKHYRFDVSAQRAKEAESPEQGSGERARPAATTELPERGRQFTTATSPDGRLQARLPRSQRLAGSSQRRRRTRGDD